MFTGLISEAYLLDVPRSILVGPNAFLSRDSSKAGSSAIKGGSGI